MNNPIMPGPGELRILLEVNMQGAVSTAELQTIIPLVQRAWRLPSAVHPSHAHDAARRAAGALWTCSRAGLSPTLALAVAELVLDAWGAPTPEEGLPDVLYDDAVLELLRHERRDADFQREAWYTLYAELFAIVSR